MKIPIAGKTITNENCVKINVNKTKTACDIKKVLMSTSSTKNKSIINPNPIKNRKTNNIHNMFDQIKIPASTNAVERSFSVSDSKKTIVISFCIVTNFESVSGEYEIKTRADKKKITGKKEIICDLIFIFSFLLTF